MSRPSMFNSNYHKTMKRRKIIFRTLIVFIGLVVIFAAYNKSDIPNLKKMVDNLWSFTDNLGRSEDKMEDANGTGEEDSGNVVMEQKPETVEKGEYVFELSKTEKLRMIYEKRETGNVFIGVKSDLENLTYDIAEDGKKIVFDNPRESDVWVYSIDGKGKRINPTNYKKYQKDDIMKEYGSNYVWAEKPEFLKDGRVVYQSFLPWFKTKNSYYLWVVDSDGNNNKKFLNTDQETPVAYGGFTDDGKLIVELGGSKYWINIDDGSKHEID